MESRQESGRRSGSSADGLDADSSSGTMSSADLIDSPWQTSASLAFITISDMWSEVVLAAIGDNAGWLPERDNGPVSSYSRTFSWSSIPCRKGRMTVRASSDVVGDVMRNIGTPLKHLTKVTGEPPCFESAASWSHRQHVFVQPLKVYSACFSHVPRSPTLRRDAGGRCQGRLGLHHRCSPAPPHALVWIQRARFCLAAHLQDAGRRHIHVTAPSLLSHPASSVTPSHVLCPLRGPPESRSDRAARSRRHCRLCRQTPRRRHLAQLLPISQEL